MPSEECQEVLRTLHEGLAGELVDFTVPQNVGKMKNSRGMESMLFNQKIPAVVV